MLRTRLGPPAAARPAVDEYRQLVQSIVADESCLATPFASAYLVERAGIHKSENDGDLKSKLKYVVSGLPLIFVRRFLIASISNMALPQRHFNGSMARLLYHTSVRRRDDRSQSNPPRLAEPVDDTGPLPTFSKAGQLLEPAPDSAFDAVVQ
jgi:hypothetical protein